MNCKYCGNEMFTKDKRNYLEKEINHQRIMLLDMGKEIQDIKAEFKNHLFDMSCHKDNFLISLPCWLTEKEKNEIIENGKL